MLVHRCRHLIRFGLCVEETKLDIEKLDYNYKVDTSVKITKLIEYGRDSLFGLYAEQACVTYYPVGCGGTQSYI